MKTTSLVVGVGVSCLLAWTGHTFPTSDKCTAEETCVSIETCALACDVFHQIDTNLTIRRHIMTKHCGFISASHKSKICCPSAQVSADLNCGREPEIDPVCGDLNCASDPQIDPICGVKTAKSPERIVGGAAAAPGDWPWVAALLYRSGADSAVDIKCGGTLISARHVLTAGHCIPSPAVNVTLVEVRLGETDELNPEEDCLEFRSECYCEDGSCDYKSGAECVKSGGCAPKHQAFTDFNIVRHPEFREDANKALHNDLAIVVLGRPATFNDFVIPLCLAAPGEEGARTNIVAGWGNVNSQVDQFRKHRGADSLQVLNVSIFSREDCRQRWKSRFEMDNYHLCAGTDRTNKAVC